jgi:hypothetical protein
VGTRNHFFPGSSCERTYRTLGVRISAELAGILDQIGSTAEGRQNSCDGSVVTLAPNSQPSRYYILLDNEIRQIIGSSMFYADYSTVTRKPLPDN